MVKFLVFIFLFTTTLIFADQTIDDILNEGVIDIEEQVSGNLVISIGNIVYADKNIGSSFSAFLEEKLETIIFYSNRFELFRREDLDDILREQELSISDLVNPKTSVRIGMLKGVQAILKGNFFESDITVQVFLELISIETGTLIAKTELTIPKSIIPRTVSTLPDNYNDAMYVLDKIYDVTSADSDDFVIRLFTTRGDGATFRNGEELVIYFVSNKNCFIKLYSIDVNGHNTQIFPNEYYNNNFIDKDVIYKIPDKRYPFKFRLGGPPFGVEYIKMVASTVQFEDIEESFEDLGIVTDEFRDKFVTVEGTDKQVAEAMFSYTIIE